MCTDPIPSTVRDKSQERGSQGILGPFSFFPVFGALHSLSVLGWLHPSTISLCLMEPPVLYAASIQQATVYVWKSEDSLGVGFLLLPHSELRSLNIRVTLPAILLAQGFKVIFVKVMVSWSVAGLSPYP